MGWQLATAVPLASCKELYTGGLLHQNYTIPTALENLVVWEK